MHCSYNVRNGFSVRTGARRQVITPRSWDEGVGGVDVGRSGSLRLCQEACRDAGMIPVPAV